MDESPRFRRSYHESILSAISAGFFLILAGSLFLFKSGLFEGVIDFFKNLDTIRVLNTDVYLPAPKTPASYMLVYDAARLFCLSWGAFLVALLVVRFVVHTSWRKKAENLSDIIFWLGAMYLIQTMLLDVGTALSHTGWFAFWAAIIMLLGVSLVVRAIVLAAVRRSHV